MAIRTGSGETVQGIFPLLFVVLFFSSISLPRDLIAAGLVPGDRHRSTRSAT